MGYAVANSYYKNRNYSQPSPYIPLPTWERDFDPVLPLTKGELEGGLTSAEALPLPNPPLAKGREWQPPTIPWNPYKISFGRGGWGVRVISCE